MQDSKLYELSNSDKKTVMETCVKLSEEVGELSEAILVTSNTYACTYKTDVAKNDVLKEVADVVIVASSIAYKMGFSVEDLQKAIGEKLAKWEMLQGSSSDN